MHESPSPLLNHCPEGLPAEAYFAPDWFAREQAGIWGQSWVYVGRLADLPGGTMRRITVAGENLVLCRNAAGEIAAFHNTCAHRGAELCELHEKPMKGKLITCPYHAWAYAFDGRLVSTAFATPTDDFNKADHGLHKVHHRLWSGLIFLSLAETPPELAPDIGLNALDNWPMDALVTGHSLTRDLACNWKVFWENYNECLHCPGIHPELVDRVPVYQKGIMSPAEAKDYAPGAPQPAALKAGTQSWTPDGAPCGPEFPDLTAAERAAGFTFATLYPTMFIVAHCDHVRLVRLEATGPETTRLTAQWLFSAETLAQPGFDAEHIASFTTLVMEQDAAACEMNQRGLRSSRFRCARLMPQEFDIHNFHRWVLARMAPRTGAQK